jgi:uncharacterized membrane protein YccC
VIQALIGGLSSNKLLGAHLAANVFIGAVASWFLVRMVQDLDPIWAIASMVAASDPHVGTAFATFRARLINAMLGCAVGLLVLAVGSTGVWKLPVAMSVSVLLSSYVVRVPVMWRQAPIVAALVMASGLTHQSKLAGIEAGVERVGEVLVGCLIGLIVSWVMARIWPVPAAISQQA